MKIFPPWWVPAISAAVLLLAACGGSSSNSAGTFSVGGTVSGLSGTLVLQNNGGDDLTRTSDGDFTISSDVADGTAYAVTIATQPAGQTCSVANSSGTIAAASVSNVAVTCADDLTVGGTVTGLSGTLVLQNNGGDDLELTENGAFTFATPLDDGAAYEVTVATRPNGQFCTLAAASGTIPGASVTDVAVTCVDEGTFRHG